jgi:outer membrane murein-binding lipoprotein Lpp
VDADSVMYEVEGLRSEVRTLQREMREVRALAKAADERAAEAMRQAEFGYERRP